MFVSRDPEATASFARSVAAQLRGGETLALVGPLGAGKTQFVKGLAAGLGFDVETVTSPTFTILQEYQARPDSGGGEAPRLALYHADFYRLESPAEAAALGLEEYFEDAGAVTVIEWADKFPALLPPMARWFYFTLAENDGGNGREIRPGAAPTAPATAEGDKSPLQR